MIAQKTKNIWEIEGEWIKFLKVNYPLKSYLIKMSNGNFLYWSPVQYTEERC